MPVVLILLAGILWGTTGTAQAFAPEGAHPITVGALRLALGGTTLLIIVYFQGKLSLKQLPFLATALAALSMAAYQPFFFTAVATTGIAVGTVVAIGSAPVLAGLLQWVFLKEQPKTTWWLATLLAITGCLLLFTQNLGSEITTLNPFGILLALGAGLSFALYTLSSKKLVEHYPPENVVAIVFTLSALILAPLLFIMDTSWVFTGNGLGVVLHLGIVTTAIAYLLFSRGLKGVTAATAVTLALAEPLTAALLGVLVVGEGLSPIAWSGVGMLLCGLIVLSLQGKSKNKKYDGGI